MWQLARRPRWIGVLILCLAIAAAFAVLGHWQLSRSIEGGEVADRDSETAVALESIAEPQQPVATVAAGQRVTVSGVLLDDFVVLEGRLNQGESGYWVVGHVIVEAAASGARFDAPSLAVALGWTATPDAASDAIARLEAAHAQPASAETFTGRFIVSEGAQESNFEEREQNALSVAALINQWETPANGVYNGYIVIDDARAGLDAIDSPVPDASISVNWLNVFYAIEWAIFGGFAIYLWFRLVRDAWEREQEDAEDAARELAARDREGESADATHVN